ncbi:MAG: hypothetical protein AAB425_08955 [Bdellovibrionota bacterium]
MNSSSLGLTAPLGQVKKLFFLEMVETPTAYLYGSSIAGGWTSARSDLDLLIFINGAQIQRFLKQLDLWKKLKFPLIDGYLCAEDNSRLPAWRFDDLFIGID